MTSPLRRRAVRAQAGCRALPIGGGVSRGGLRAARRRGRGLAGAGLPVRGLRGGRWRRGRVASPHRGAAGTLVGLCVRYRTRGGEARDIGGAGTLGASGGD